MEIITSHTNADFDALASMVAAKKLYPGARLVFPGSQEKSMRDFFLESAFYALEIDRLKNIDVDSITGLIIVDNRNPARLGKLAGALKRPGVSVSIYDHHPAADGDIRGELEIVEEVGATTTIMVELLRQKGLPITPLEATIFALGIYEETGLAHVRVHHGAGRAGCRVPHLPGGPAQHRLRFHLSRADRRTGRDPEQPDRIRQKLRHQRRAGGDHDAWRSRISFRTSRVLAHKIRDMESLDVLFLVVQMGDKTHVIARSRIPQVNVGMVLGELGGGGHATAASAVVKDMTHVQTTGAPDRHPQTAYQARTGGERGHDLAGQDHPVRQHHRRGGRGHDPVQRERAADHER